MNPRDVLLTGAHELDAVLGPARFCFSATDEGRSSGGLYASGEYLRGDRRLELHFRWSLGLVKYHVGGLSLSHADYVRAVKATAGATEQAKYPGFSANPVDGFRHLADDLAHFGETFLSGSDAEFAALHAWAKEHPQAKGLAALP